MAETVQLQVAPGEVVFRQRDDSEDGIYIVAGGTLGVFLQEDNQRAPGQPPSAAPPRLTNVLREGESVGDVDVLDGMLFKYYTLFECNNRNNKCTDEVGFAQL